MRLGLDDGFRSRIVPPSNVTLGKSNIFSTARFNIVSFGG